MRYILRLMGETEINFTHAGHGTGRMRAWKQKPFARVKLNHLSERNFLMHRNPLDTAVSVYFQIHKHELPKMNKRNLSYIKSGLLLKLPPQNIQRFVLHPVFGIENICKFNRAWLDYFSEHLPDCPIISYEDATSDLRAVIQLFERYLEISECDIDEILSKCHFSEMKKVELQGKSNELRLHGPSKDPNAMKVRKGIVQGYTEYLDEDTIKKAQQIAHAYGFEV
ncbi:MAG: sulfotransferase domain-containing protein [Lentisphaeria bacterium]|nr:sulfotransferase domain-containing protein [Lentisphaeria bacterium]NQZ71419.1 sulfotransferase domain-containing protein [Lentisphaeria bacterium]